MDVYQRIKLAVKWLVGNGIAANQKEVGRLLGYKNESSFSQVINGKVPLPGGFVDRLCELSSVLNPYWILEEKGDMLKKDNEAIPLSSNCIINVPLVNQYAYAGYLSGYSDVEYIESLPTIPFIVDHEAHGHYIAFEVRGDSMNDGTEESYLEGDRLLCREIKRELWADSKLHIRKWDFVIVHKDGILIKRILDHNVEEGTITMHSLNPIYPDRVINLAEVYQIFNVIEFWRPRRR